MQSAGSVESFRFLIERTWILNRLKVAGLAMAVLGLSLASTAAFASCGLLSGAESSATQLPALAATSPQSADFIGDEGDAASKVSIVGLWQTKYTAGGALFAESFKVWHGDGTELDNIDQDPAMGSICLGVWKQVSARQVRLHHVGWVFGSDGKPAGSFTIDETDTLAENGNSYAGTFTFRTYDANGKPTGVEVSGKIASTRITVN